LASALYLVVQVQLTARRFFYVLILWCCAALTPKGRLLLCYSYLPKQLFPCKFKRAKPQIQPAAAFQLDLCSKNLPSPLAPPCKNCAKATLAVAQSTSRSEKYFTFSAEWPESINFGGNLLTNHFMQHSNNFWFRMVL
jgi:hypothetical protein